MDQIPWNGEGKNECAFPKEGQFIQRMLTYLPDAIVVHCNGIIEYVNYAALAMFRAAHERLLLRRSIFDFLHGQDREAGRYRIRMVETSEEQLSSTIHKMIRLDGERFDAEMTSIKVYESAGKTYIQTVIRSITELITYEQSLEMSALRYKRLIEFLPEPIVISDRGIIIYGNKMAHKLVKLPKECTLDGRSIFEYIHPRFHAESLQVVQSVMQSDAPSPFMERTLICHNGEHISVEISSMKIYNYSESPVTLSVLRDITERKRAEELFLKSEKLSVVGQLAAGVAHEIRNPLTALKGFTQLLRKELGSKVSYIDIMLEELDRISFIVNEFMSLSKPHAVHFDYKSLYSIITSVISILEPQAIMGGVNIVLDRSFHEPLPPIFCEENQLKQVFMNVIKNAIDSMPGGGSVTVSVQMAASDRITIRIEDQGPGIPNHILQRIGEPFFTTKNNGTGLGLMVCHRIVESHHGTLLIASQENRGTAVEITLPLQHGGR